MLWICSSSKYGTGTVIQYKGIVAAPNSNNVDPDQCCDFLKRVCIRIRI